MVVVSDSWVKNVEMIISNNEPKMTAKAMLICRQNSHPFQDRTLLLDETIKVGRSVARARAKPTNAIFDCKVLSRNHAMLWYENGKFFLQDTKSSNGTFVNNNKLTPETEHHEVSSGDIVQFGVDVVENNRKVTHGCIIATLKLYLPDGKEAKASPSISENRHGMVPLDELYRLNQIIQEASDREECLQKKLIKLQDMLQNAKLATSSCWAAYVGEERLLSRIATLETQLSQANKNWNDDRCKQELSKIQDENVAYQVAAIEALEKLHTEKLDAVAFVTELEIKENAVQQEANLAKIQVETLQKELDELLRKLIEEQKKTDEIRDEYETKIQDLQTQLDEKHKEITALDVKIDDINVKTNNCNIIEEFEKCFIYTDDDVKVKKEMLENEEQDDSQFLNDIVSDLENHITLDVGPVKMDVVDDEETSDNLEDTDSVKTVSDETIISNDFTAVADLSETPNSGKEKKHVTFDLEENHEIKTSDEEPESIEDVDSNNDTETENGDDTETEKENRHRVSSIDSNTLKYHFQSSQNELKKRIETLDRLCKDKDLKMDELERILATERKFNAEIKADNEILKEELKIYKNDLENVNRERDRLKNEVDSLLLLASKETKKGDEEKSTTVEEGKKDVTYEELVAVEEELVLLKERFSQVNDDKLRLQKEMDSVREQYNSVRNRSHNMTFFYVAPLILVVLYLLFSKMFS